MATLILRSTDVGAPTLSGTNGTLCAVLDWALVQNGWAIEYTASNNRIYRAGTGNRRRLFVAHDSTVSGDARLATIRGCEDATAADSGTLTDPFPTVAQVANASSTVLTSTTANSTAREYIIIVSPTHVLMGINCGGANNINWDAFAFGDLAAVDAADTWATIAWVGNSTSNTSSSTRAINSSVASYPVSSSRVFFCRSIDGTLKSSHGIFCGPTGSSSIIAMCAMANSPTMRAGYGNRVVRWKAGVNCLGSTTLTAGPLALVNRGYLPNLWLPIHSNIGTITADDTWEDLDTGADLKIIPAGAANAAIFEVSDTWSPPSG